MDTHKVITGVAVEYDGTLILQFGNMGDPDYDYVYFPMNLPNGNPELFRPYFVGSRYNMRSKVVIFESPCPVQVHPGTDAKSKRCVLTIGHSGKCRTE